MSLPAPDPARTKAQLQRRDAVILAAYVWAAAAEQTPLASVARNAAFTVFPGSAGAPSLPSPRAQALEKSAFLLGPMSGTAAKFASSPRGSDSTSPLRVSIGGGAVEAAVSGSSSAPQHASAGRSVVVARRAADASDQLAHLRRHLASLLALLFPAAAVPADVSDVLSILLRVAPGPTGAGSAPDSAYELLRMRGADLATPAAIASAVLEALDLRPALYPLAWSAPGMAHHDPTPEASAALVHVPGAKKEGVLRTAPAAATAPSIQALPYALVEDAMDSTVVLALATGSVDIVGCARSTIVLGPTALHVTIEGCDGCTVVAAAAHITVHNCTDTTLLLWTEHRPLLLGDNRRLRLGPYAARYRGLAAQCAAARLQGALGAVTSGSGRETLVAAQQLAALGGRTTVAALNVAKGAKLPPCVQLEAALARNFWSRPVEVRFVAAHGSTPGNSSSGAVSTASGATEEADVTGLVSPTGDLSAAQFGPDDLDSDPVRIAELLGRCGSRDAWSILPPAQFLWRAAPSSGTVSTTAQVSSAAEAVLSVKIDSSPGSAVPAARGGAVIAVTRGDGQASDMLLPPLASHDAERQHLALPWAYAAELDTRIAAEQRLRKRIDEVLSELGSEAAARLQAAVQAAFAVRVVCWEHFRHEHVLIPCSIVYIGEPLCERRRANDQALA